MWRSFDNGASVGTTGSERGVIVLDEEHDDGARITMERDGHTPWSITCGIYGAFMHTAFASTEGEARAKYGPIKSELIMIINETDRNSRYERMRKLSETY